MARYLTAAEVFEQYKNGNLEIAKQCFKQLTKKEAVSMIDSWLRFQALDGDSLQDVCKLIAMVAR